MLFLWHFFIAAMSWLIALTSDQVKDHIYKMLTIAILCIHELINISRMDVFGYFSLPNWLVGIVLVIAAYIWWVPSYQACFLNKDLLYPPQTQYLGAYRNHPVCLSVHQPCPGHNFLTLLYG